MPPRKLPIVRVSGLIITALSVVCLGAAAVELIIQVLPAWQPHWTNAVPPNGSVYQSLTQDLLERLPWLLFSWISIAALAIGLRVTGMWPNRTNLVRG